MTIVSVSDSTDTSASPSPSIWGSCPIEEILTQNTGYIWWDDFIGNDDVTATPYLIDESDDNASVANVAFAGGMLRLAIAGDDNEEVFILGGNGVNMPFAISDTAGSDKKLWFEARIRASAVTDDVCGIVVGLADANLAAGDNTLQAADTAALADIGFIGFQTLQADGDSVDFFYRKNGQTGVQAIDGACALVAATWKKLGFVYDPAAVAAERIKVYTDGALNATKITSTQIATATFPDAVALNFVLGAKVGSDAALNLDIDWVKIAQMR